MATKSAMQLPWDSIDARFTASAPDPAVPLDYSPYPLAPARSSGGWTIPPICAGIALIASCLLIPAADENHRLAYEGQGLKNDLEQLQKQVATNEEFLKRVSDDPVLSERLAQRQMKMVREGTSVLALKGQPLGGSASPFLLMTLPPPEPLPEYQSMGGGFARLCRQPRVQLYLIGGGLLMIAVGLVLCH